jgi:hypothetical protein
VCLVLHVRVSIVYEDTFNVWLKMLCIISASALWACLSCLTIVLFNSPSHQLWEAKDEHEWRCPLSKYRLHAVQLFACNFFSLTGCPLRSNQCKIWRRFGSQPQLHFLSGLDLEMRSTRSSSKISPSIIWLNGWREEELAPTNCLLRNGTGKRIP